MSYVKLSTLAVFMLTIFSRECPSFGTVCSILRSNSCGNIIEYICIPHWIHGGICK
ncbi:hypothetical protein MtrunA17_Chr3g0092731 [Medicago truncatula]|uniref:Nodule Cysteine-Rich (NCR) secreted peptide n=1 Tax=Medicago truncatula TaxID=3880 RepID=A0A396IPX7_MEDTR|nr:hypothetical protein MtrunA17_Chr3g0092731 [Medicago truncatula]